MEAPTIVEVRFDSSSPDWSRTDLENLMFLRMTMNYAQNLLQARGHLFVNEVFDLFHTQRRPFGQLTGWLYERSDKIVYDIEKQDDGYSLKFHTHGDIHQSI